MNYSPKMMITKQKLIYFEYMMQADNGLEKTTMSGKIEEGEDNR